MPGLQEALKAWLDSESDYRLTEQKSQVRVRKTCSSSALTKVI